MTWHFAHISVPVNWKNSNKPQTQTNPNPQQFTSMAEVLWGFTGWCKGCDSVHMYTGRRFSVPMVLLTALYSLWQWFIQDVSCNRTCSEAQNRHVSLVRYYHWDLSVLEKVHFSPTQTLNHQGACLHGGFVVAGPICCLFFWLFPQRRCCTERGCFRPQQGNTIFLEFVPVLAWWGQEKNQDSTA